MHRLIIAGVFASVLSACAGTGSGSLQSSLAYPDDAAGVELIAEHEVALVTVRYPAVMSENALNLAVDRFATRPIGASGAQVVATAAAAPREDVQRVLNSKMLKTVFYANELYDALVERLGADRVILAPQRIDANGQLFATDLVGAAPTPTVLTIDFLAYSFPDSTRLMESEPATFADLVSPLIQIKQNPELAPNGDPRLLVSRPFFDQPVSSIPFVEHLNQSGQPTAEASATVMTAAAPARIDTIAIYELERVQFSRDLMEIYVSAEQPADRSPFYDSYAVHLADWSVDYLNQVTPQDARSAVIGAFADLIDPTEVWPASAPSSNVREATLFQLYQREADFLAAQSARTRRDLASPQRQLALREILAGEYELLEERREMARLQNMSMALAMFGAATAGYASSQAASMSAMSGANYSSFQNSLNQLTYSSISLAQEAGALQAESQALGLEFDAEYAAIYEENVDYQADWLGADTQPLRLLQIRERLAELYLAAFEQSAGSAVVGSAR